MESFLISAEEGVYVGDFLDFIVDKRKVLEAKCVWKVLRTVC